MTGPRPKVLYVLGTQRGGTTIAGRVIGQLPGFAFLGELRKLWQVGLPEGRTCGCGLGYDACPVWSAVLPPVMDGTDSAAMRRWQDATAPDRHSSLQAWRMSRAGHASVDVQPYAARLGATYVGLAAATGARVLVDTSKLPADAVVVSRLREVDAYFLELVRDPRGTVHSALQRTGGGTRRLHARPAVTGAAGWLVRHAAARAILRDVGPARATVVTYERLMAEPNAVLAEIAAFVGESAPSDGVVVDGKVALDVAHTPIGGGRFGADTVELERDDRWVTGLGAGDRRIVAALTWPIARRFGYGRAGHAR